MKVQYNKNVDNSEQILGSGIKYYHNCPGVIPRRQFLSPVLINFQKSYMVNTTRGKTPNIDLNRHMNKQFLSAEASIGKAQKSYGKKMESFRNIKPIKKR